jgi:hypothetical protein
MSDDFKDKRASLLHHEFNYGLNNFYSTGAKSKTDAVPILIILHKFGKF